jgi:hypothetical protein
MPKKNNHVQKNLIVEFFRKNPNRDIKHPEVVDWVAATYKKKELEMFSETQIGPFATWPKVDF